MTVDFPIPLAQVRGLSARDSAVVEAVRQRDSYLAAILDSVTPPSGFTAVRWVEKNGAGVLTVEAPDPKVE